jgi:hypothetical protein
MGKPVMTGPDYLIGAAEQVRADQPLAGEFQDMVISAITPAGDPLSEGPIFPEVSRELEPHEEAALTVFRAAVLVAIQQGDQQSLEELLAWGLAMLLRYDRYHERRSGPASGLPPPP